MKIGYPCINRSIGCNANSIFRLKNYSEETLIEKIRNNINCLKKILEYNVMNGFLFFRISSDLIPFASHPICKFNWQNFFNKQFLEIGNFIKKNNIRISMHPDQFVIINSPNKEVLSKSILELKWHCEVLNLMGLDSTAKVQIHVGGLYGDKEFAINNFIENYNKLPNLIKKRLVIENDDRLFSLTDCIKISKLIKIPVVFDSFHHSILNHGETLLEAIKLANNTWTKKDGILMTDYSSQEPNSKIGKHANHIDIEDFKNYIKVTNYLDFDIMLELKDKEKSAIEVLNIIKEIKNS